MFSILSSAGIPSHSQPSNCRKANKRDLPGVSGSCTGCEEETILAICNKVSVMPPDCCASLRNLRLVHYSKHLGNGVLQFFGIRPPKMSPPFILEMTALSRDVHGSDRIVGFLGSDRTGSDPIRSDKSDDPIRRSEFTNDFYV